MYCLVKDGQIERGPEALPKHWEGILNLDLCETPYEFGWYPVVSVDVPSGSYLSNATYSFDGFSVIEAGDILPIPEPKTPVPSEVSEAQFISACVLSGIITFQEGKNYLARGELPALMQGVLDSLPEEQRIVVELKAIGSATFAREAIIFKALVTSGSFTDEQIDQIFTLAGTL